MYGFNVADAETIPSYFASEFDKLSLEGTSIRVVNMGTPYYFSYQEIVAALHRVAQGEVPDIIIFLDGLNDVIQPGSSYSRTPFFTPDLRGSLSGGEGESVEEANHYAMPPGLSREAVFDRVLSNYLENIRFAQATLRPFGVTAYFFWQPVPFYRYPNRQNDPVCDQREFPEFEYIYPKVEAAAQELESLYFLGNLLEEEQGTPFIDIIHYSPAFHRRLAREILDVIDFGGLGSSD